MNVKKWFGLLGLLSLGAVVVLFMVLAISFVMPKNTPPVSQGSEDDPYPPPNKPVLWDSENNPYPQPDLPDPMPLSTEAALAVARAYCTQLYHPHLASGERRTELEKLYEECVEEVLGPTPTTDSRPKQYTPLPTVEPPMVAVRTAGAGILTNTGGVAPFNKPYEMNTVWTTEVDGKEIEIYAGGGGK